MKQRMARFILSLGVVFMAAGSLQAQDEKPLGSGWLSLDGSVGLLDNSIASGKAALRCRWPTCSPRPKPKPRRRLASDAKFGVRRLVIVFDFNVHCITQCIDS